MVDVVVIGAGPSGASCAYNIKRFNPAATVLLMEKAEFPRYKPCGGGISPEVMNYLDFDVQDGMNLTCGKVTVVAKGRTFNTTSANIFMVRREVFDHFLVKKSQEKGVVVLIKCEVVDIEKTKSSLVVKTNNGNFSAKIVVLAEGSSGKLARKLNIDPKNRVAAALEYEHYLNENDGVMEIDFDQNSDGYAWVFPKADGLSIGIGRFAEDKRISAKLPEKLKKYLQNHGITDINRKNLHGHPVQLYSGRRKLVHDRIMLIGEIAGCVDPLSAEGIRPAIKSGYLAAQRIAQALNQNDISHLKKYDSDFHHEIGRDFQYARIASYFFTRYNSNMLSLAVSTGSLERYVDIFSGRATYRDYLNLKRIFKMIKIGFSRVVV